jgi:hypothetical protein
MDHPTSAITLAPDPYGGEGARWRAEAGIVTRDGILEDGERGLGAAMFDPSAGVFVVDRRRDAAGPPIGGVGRDGRPVPARQMLTPAP